MKLEGLNGRILEGLGEKFDAVLNDPFTFYVCNPDLAEELLADPEPRDPEYRAEYDAARDALASLDS